MNTIKLTRENLHELSASPGRAGFTRKQIELLGFSWPPQKGWLTSLIGKEIDVALYEQVKGSGHKKWKNEPRPKSPREIAIERLRELQVYSGDQEIDHIKADKVLCDLLVTLGAGDVVAEWDKVAKWYA